MNGWASHYIEALQRGERVSFRPRGNSMTPRITSGALVTCEPVTAETTVAVGDAVLCQVAGAQYLHLVTAINENSYLIGNNHGGINGWTSRARVYGRCVKVEP